MDNKDTASLFQEYVNYVRQIVNYYELKLESKSLDSKLNKSYFEDITNIYTKLFNNVTKDSKDNTGDNTEDNTGDKTEDTDTDDEDDEDTDTEDIIKHLVCEYFKSRGDPEEEKGSDGDKDVNGNIEFIPIEEIMKVLMGVSNQ